MKELLGDSQHALSGKKPLFKYHFLKQILIWALFKLVSFRAMLFIFLCFLLLFLSFIIIFLAMSHNLWALNSSDKGSNPGPQQWKGGVPATGIPCWFSVAPEHSAEVLSHKAAMCLPEKMCLIDRFLFRHSWLCCWLLVQC